MKKIIFFIIINFLLFDKISNSTIRANKDKKNYDFHPYKFKTNKKNALLSIIVRYSWEKIFPFIKSVIQANFYNVDIIMFVNEISKSVINNLKSFGIIVYKIKQKLKNPHDIYIERWKIYLDFLKNNINKYNLVLSVDIKDTIFQNELFSLYEKYEELLGFSYEDLTIDNSIYRNSIIELFGINTLNKIKNKRIINAGTVWGTINAFIQFSHILYNKLLELSEKSPKSNDQSAVNYLIYHENILNNCTKIISDEYGPVMTLGLTLRKNIRLDKSNNIINYNGYIASIIHQYDRHPDIKKKIIEKFCPELIRNKIIIKFFIILQLFVIILYLKSKIYLYRIKRFINKSSNKIRKL